MISYLITALSLLAALFVFFGVITAAKYAILRNGWHTNSLAKFLIVIFGGLFKFLDKCANYFFYAPIALHWPNQWNEGRTISEHADAIIREYVLIEDSRELSGIENWTMDVATFTCKHLNQIERNHCKHLGKVQ